MLRNDLLNAQACVIHRKHWRWDRAHNYPCCPLCQEILTQVANSCSHNREELRSFVVEFGKLVDRKMGAQA